MKTSLACLLILCSTLLYSCGRTPAPTAPTPPKPSEQTVSLAEYGEALDSTFYKVWSDSSWESFDKDTTVNGTTYTIIIGNTGFEDVYGPDGLAGFGQYGSPIIMFDSTLASFPDSMVVGKTYSEQTTFSDQGVGYLITEQTILKDTGAVTVPFGSFSDCLHMQSVTSISGAGQSQSQTDEYWYAQGPSDIEHLLNTGQTLLMAYGFVNGQAWGPSAAGEFPRLKPEVPAATARSVFPSTHENPGFNISRIAPKILRGIITNDYRN